MRSAVTGVGLLGAGICKSAEQALELAAGKKEMEYSFQVLRFQPY